MGDDLKAKTDLASSFEDDEDGPVLQRRNSELRNAQRDAVRERVEENLEDPIGDPLENALHMFGEKWTSATSTLNRVLEGKVSLEEVLLNEEGEEGDVDEHIPFTDRKWFGAIIAISVVANAIQMGIEVDHPDPEDCNPCYYVWLENIFAVIFTLEMLCKFYTERLSYFLKGWNLLDFLPVTFSVADLWLMDLLVGDSINTANLSSLRMLRMLRIARMIRLLKVFKDLWLIVKGILDSTKAIFWASLLLVAFLYVFAILLVKLVKEPRPDPFPDYYEDWDAYENYGNMHLAMFTLFEMSLDALVMRPVIEKQPYLICIFVLYLATTTFAVLNVIIGVVVESTSKANADTDLAIELELTKDRARAVQKISQIICSMDADQSGNIELKELKDGLSLPEVNQVFSDMPLPLDCTARDIFDIMNPGGTSPHLTFPQMTKHLLRAISDDDRTKLLDIKSGFGRLHRLTVLELGKRKAAQDERFSTIERLRTSVAEGKQQLERLEGLVLDLAGKVAPGLSLDKSPLIEEPLATSKESMPKRLAIVTTMKSPAKAGDVRIEVASLVGFAVGDVITVGDERNTVEGFGSLLLGSPLLNDHPVGTEVVIVKKQEPALGTQTMEEPIRGPPLPSECVPFNGEDVIFPASRAADQLRPPDAFQPQSARRRPHSKGSTSAAAAPTAATLASQEESGGAAEQATRPALSSTPGASGCANGGRLHLEASSWEGRDREDTDVPPQDVSPAKRKHGLNVNTSSHGVHTGDATAEDVSPERRHDNVVVNSSSYGVHTGYTNAEDVSPEKRQGALSFPTSSLGLQEHELRGGPAAAPAARASAEALDEGRPLYAPSTSRATSPCTSASRYVPPMPQTRDESRPMPPGVPPLDLASAQAVQARSQASHAAEVHEPVPAAAVPPLLLHNAENYLEV